MTNTRSRAVAVLAALAIAALASNAAGAKSGGGAHSGANSASAASAKTARDVSSGQASGKRMWKPVKAVKENAGTNSAKSKLTPDKVEAKGENVRR